MYMRHLVESISGSALESGDNSKRRIPGHATREIAVGVYVAEIPSAAADSYDTGNDSTDEAGQMRPPDSSSAERTAQRWGLRQPPLSKRYSGGLLATRVIGYFLCLQPRTQPDSS